MLNDSAPTNIRPMSVTRDTSHSPMGSKFGQSPTADNARHSSTAALSSSLFISQGFGSCGRFLLIVVVAAVESVLAVVVVAEGVLAVVVVVEAGVVVLLVVVDIDVDVVLVVVVGHIDPDELVNMSVLLAGE